ncbi:BTAD domain-containing putative transcriptional regulator [Streptomyces sp. NPDC059398]|uniref:AfsR/SARP family transcriptional regulator n=1 Tax=Streptomyces sp. NPDC059398 TaxID=3346820 RepID=UPI0036C2CE29
MLEGSGTALRFGLLGQVCLFDPASGEPHRVGGTKIRVLLAALLREPGRAVSTGALREMLWGDSPPPTARASLQNFAARLRRMLDDPHRLRALDTGYRLSVSEDELDVRVFQRHVVAARTAGSARRWPEVLHESRAALALWRGAPLDGVRAPLADDSYVRRLEEERLSLLEWRAEARLALGHSAAGLVPGLTELADQYPLREAFHRQLMLALHRSDRQAEALEVHRVLRRTLAEQLGTEPGAAVAAAHREVLGPARTAAPAPHAGDPRAARVVPAQVPPAPGCFTGRHTERAALRAALGGSAGDGPVGDGPVGDGPVGEGPVGEGPVGDGSAGDGPRLAVVSGMPGVGKSALVAQVAHDLRDTYPDGQLYVHLHGAAPDGSRLSPRGALAALLRALGRAPQSIPEDPDAGTALLRSLLAPTRTLMVLDDAAGAAQVRPLLPAGAGCGVLVTSRYPLTALDGARHMTLRPMTPPESAALLRAASGRRECVGPDHQLVRLTGGLPLALRVVAARLAARGTLAPDRLADRLAGDGLLEHLEYDDLSVRRPLTVAVQALRASDRSADRDAARALCRIGAVNLPDYTSPLLARLSGLSPTRAADALDRLVQTALLEEPVPERFLPHDLVREFAREEAATRTPSPAVLRGTALRWYAAGTRRLLCAVLPPSQDREDRMYAPPEGRTDEGEDDAFPADITAWAEAEVANIVALVGQTVAADDPPTDHRAASAGVVRQLFPFLQRQGRLGEMEVLATHAVLAAGASGDVRAEALALSDLAGFHFLSGRLQQALSLIDRGLGMLRASGDLVGVRRSLSHRGTLLNLLGRPQEAEEALREALRLARQLDDPVGESVVLGNLGNLVEQRDPAEAVHCHERSLALAERTDDPRIRNTAYCNIGYALLRAGNPAAARRHFERGLTGLREFSDWHAETHTRLGLIRTLRELRRTEGAVAESAALVDRAVERRDHHASGLARHEYGRVLAAAGRGDEARAQWRAALDDLAGTDSSELPGLRKLLGLPEVPEQAG